jgi:hypothetical protein
MGKTKEQVRIDGKPVFNAVLYESMRKAALDSVDLYPINHGFLAY